MILYSFLERQHECRCFFQYFGELTDIRQNAKINYPLFDVLSLTMSAILAGAEEWEDIEDFGETHFLIHDCIISVLSIVQLL
uniref:transposase family protein n=1 Tax=Xenorhabdus sp. TH1 TaxID=3130166 RepID=UPI004040269A